MMMGDDMKVFSKLRLALRIVHGNYMTKVLHLNYLRFKLINVKNAINMVNSHEQEGTNKFTKIE
jgi:hypothetical protein